MSTIGREKEAATMRRLWWVGTGVAILLSGCGGGSHSTTAASGVNGTQSSPSTFKLRVGLGAFAFGPGGRLYGADCQSGIVFALDSVGTAHAVVGSGGSPSPPFGDGGPALKASLSCPQGLVFDHNGRLLISDGHNRIRRIDADGTMTTIAGLKSPPVNDLGSFSGDGGKAVDATLDTPVGLTVDGAGNIYIGDRNNERVRKIAPDGIISTLAGDGDIKFAGDSGPATKASLNWPLSSAVDAAGDVYIADDNHNRVRKVAPDGTITTVIGDGRAASTGDGGPAVKARVNDPQGVAVDAAGNLYVSESGGNSDVPGGNRIRRITPDGVVTTFAGTGHDGLTGIPGPALSADVPQPGWLAIRPDGALYANDEYGRVLRIDLGSRRVTVAGGTPNGVTVTVPWK